MRLLVIPATVAVVLAAIAVVLLLGHALGVIGSQYFGLHQWSGFVKMVDFDQERNLPTLFSTFLFALNASLLVVVWRAARRADKSQKAWLYLACIFVFLSLDENLSLHEELNEPFRLALNTSGGFLQYAWVIPYTLAVAAIAVFIFPMVRRLAPGIRKLFLLSAGLYLSGALGMEMTSAHYRGNMEMVEAETDVVYRIIISCEESLEIAGLIMLVYALLTLLAREYGGFSLVLPPEEPLTHESSANEPRQGSIVSAG